MPRSWKGFLFGVVRKFTDFCCSKHCTTHSRQSFLFPQTCISSTEDYVLSRNYPVKGLRKQSERNLRCLDLDGSLQIVNVPPLISAGCSRRMQLHEFRSPRVFEILVAGACPALSRIDVSRRSYYLLKRLIEARTHAHVSRRCDGSWVARNQGGEIEISAAA